MKTEIEVTKEFTVEIDPYEVYDTLSLSEQEEFIIECFTRMPERLRNDIFRQIKETEE